MARARLPGGASRGRGARRGGARCAKRVSRERRGVASPRGGGAPSPDTLGEAFFSTFSQTNARRSSRDDTSTGACASAHSSRTRSRTTRWRRTRSSRLASPRSSARIRTTPRRGRPSPRARRPRWRGARTPRRDDARFWRGVARRGERHASSLGIVVRSRPGSLIHAPLPARHPAPDPRALSPIARHPPASQGEGGPALPREGERVAAPGDARVAEPGHGALPAHAPDAGGPDP